MSLWGNNVKQIFVGAVVPHGLFSFVQQSQDMDNWTTMEHEPHTCVATILIYRLANGRAKEETRSGPMIVSHGASLWLPAFRSQQNN
jgi:hypothetical protein